MHTKAQWGAVLLAVACLIATQALAQSTAAPAFDLERLILNPGGRDGLVIGGGDALEQRGVRLSLLGHYEHAPLVVLDGRTQRIATLVGGRVSGHVTAAFGLHRYLELGVQIPVVLWQGGTQDAATLGFSAPQATALGSPWVHARSGILQQREGSPLDLSVDLLVNVPVGAPGAFTADSDPSLFPRLGLGRSFGERVRVALEGGAWFRVSPGVLSGASSRTSTPAALVGLGVSTLGQGARFEVSVRSTIPFDGQLPAAELLAGARLPVGPVEFQLLGGPGFGRLAGTPAFRVLAGVSFATPPDACTANAPPEACPALDFDGDGVPNGLDACLREAGPLKGCPEPDQDRDGVSDAKDRCPAAAGPAAHDGCPDSDGDGVHDGDDRCVQQPGPDHGCPRKDSDGDGVVDEEDACPTVAGPNRGCPPDRDGDGVEDARDSCIDEAGTPENDGCAKKSLVKLESDRLVIREKVYFDSAKAKIQPRSFELLRSVAKVLVSHPEVTKVFIDGHTDAQGKPAQNRKLALARATAVRDFLVKAGVDPRRLEPRGFGPDRPIADNATAEGREQNRRVEFVIETPTVTRETK
ncbi:MAG: OmpA family protein [Myxococcota bacterium]